MVIVVGRGRKEGLRSLDRLLPDCLSSQQPRSHKVALIQSFDLGNFEEQLRPLWPSLAVQSGQPAKQHGLVHQRRRERERGSKWKRAAQLPKGIRKPGLLAYHSPSARRDRAGNSNKKTGGCSAVAAAAAASSSSAAFHLRRKRSGGEQRSETS